MARKIVNDINSIDINLDDSLRMLMDRFYDVMRVNGMSMVTNHTDGSTTMCDSEWILYKTLFLKRIDMMLNIQDLIICPEDLQK